MLTRMGCVDQESDASWTMRSSHASVGGSLVWRCLLPPFWWRLER
jgi:hypothetical protein